MQSTTTQLLTLLNVSALKSTKRKRLDETPFAPGRKLNARNKTAATANDTNTALETPDAGLEEEKDVAMDEDQDEGVEDGAQGEEATLDPHTEHFGSAPAVLTDSRRNAVDASRWSRSSTSWAHLQKVCVSLPEGCPGSTTTRPKPTILERMLNPFLERQKRLSPEQTKLQDDLLSALSTDRDLYVTKMELTERAPIREVVSLHALNHVMRKGRRVLKNNERLTNHAKTNPSAPPLEDVQDQGFTRPSVLILLPFRNSALAWVDALTSHTPAPTFQVQNHARFRTEFGIPEGAEDKLRGAAPGTYPDDHVHNFSGNVDDSFRVGIKITKKSIKLFSEFYGSDIVLASPLGLRMSIEKEGSADFLSSVEVLIADQLDVLTMQNWDHVQFVFSHMNKIPKESHDADFSRIKPWFLDGHAALLRQSIFLTAYETPETRSLYNGLRNVSGKIRTERTWPALQVPAGLDTQFTRFECVSPKDELEKRWEAFTKTLMPAVLKSAVQSANTLVFVPSSFDFIRVHNWFRKRGDVSFAVLSEYSTPQDISRARQAFFAGKKAFLLVSERFHFFRRYKLRGVRNVVFFGLPDHAEFYREMVMAPFLDDGVEPEEITVRVLWSKFDAMRLERIVGTKEASEMCATS